MSYNFAMRDIFQDIKFTWRSLTTRPVFAATAILTLALGVGMNTTVFSLVNAVLLRPLPVHQPDRLAELYTSSEDRQGGVTSYADLKDLRASNTAFSGLAARSLMFANLSWNGRSELLIGELATSNYFDVLGIHAQVGRFFLAEEEQVEGASLVTVLNSRFWKNRFGGDPGVLGQTLQLNGKHYTVVGVAPEGFEGMMPGLSPDLWLPIMMVEGIDPFGQISTLPSPGKTKLERRGYRWLWVTGRLKDGVNLAEAQSQAQSITTRLSQDFPQSNDRLRATLIPTNDVRLNPDLDGYLKSASMFLLAAVGLVLLVSSTNVAGMFLARSSARRREIALRLALGTSRWRLIRQLLIESVSIALAGGVGGLALSVGATSLLQTIQLPIPISVHFNLAPDWRVFAFTLGVSLVTGVIFGLVPAFQATRTDLILDLKGQHSDESRGRWKFLRSGLVVGQLALSLMLLVGAALMARSLAAAATIDLGFDAERYALVQIDLGMYGYDQSRGLKFYADLQESFRRLPGAEGVSTASRTPLSININTTELFKSTTTQPGETPVTVDDTAVSEDYFDVMHVGIGEGRKFGPGDRSDSPPVAIVNQAMARQFWPGQSAVGKQVRNRSGKIVEIVGVSSDYKIRTVGELPRPFIHFAQAQAYNPYSAVIVRTKGPALTALPALRREIAALDPNLVPFDITTMDSEVARSLMPVRMSAILLGAFGAFAVFLAALGLYGVIAYSIGRRTREIGVRMALGATPGVVLKQIVAEGSRLIVAGLVLGLAGAAAVSRLIQSLLYGISSVDWLSFSLAAGVMAAIALAANFIPAFAASRVDPIKALRSE